MGDASGLLLLPFYEAVILSVPVSLILLIWYRRTVTHRMRIIASEATALPESEPPTSVQQRQTEPDAVGVAHPDRATETPDSLHLRIAVIYALGGGTASAVITGLLFASAELEATPLRIFMIWYSYCWPIAPTLAVLVVMPRNKGLIALAIYLSVGVGVICLWTAIVRFSAGKFDLEPLLNAGRFLGFLATGAVDVFLIILVTGNRRWRAVSAPTLASLMLFGFATLAALESFVRAYDQPWVPVGALVTLGPNGWFMLMAVPVGWACWQLLQWLRKRFAEKAFSDVQLLVDAWWLIVIFGACVTLSNEIGWYGLVGLTAFVAYRFVVAIGLRLWAVDVGSSGARRLLLLRVFGFQQRTEQLFDAIALRWRFVGPAAMIGAADLATRTISVERLVAFLSGRFGDEFVRNEPELIAKLNRVDERRDPDGRFRIAEFFCHDSSWRETLKALLKQTDVVLMDLRSFSRGNSGCLFELQQLVESEKLCNTVFVVDDATDAELFSTTLAQAGAGNFRGEAAGALASLAVEHGARTAVEQDRIYQALCRIASDSGQASVARPA